MSSNEIRNNYVVRTNINSSRIDNILRLLNAANSTKNVVEVSRNNVFNVAYYLEDLGLDFWDREFVFRDLLLINMEDKIISMLNSFLDDNHLKNLFQTKTMFYRKKLREYNMVLAELEDFNLKRDFYNIVCNTVDGLYFISEDREAYLDMYTELSLLGLLIGAEETDEYNDLEMLSTIMIKNRINTVFNKFLTDEDSLTDEEVDLLYNLLSEKCLVVNSSIYNKLQKKGEVRSRK